MWRWVGGYHFGVTRLSGVVVAVLSGKETQRQALLWGWQRKPKCLQGFCPLKNAMPYLAYTLRLFFYGMLPFPTCTRQAYVLAYLGRPSPQQVKGRTQLDLHGGAALVGLGLYSNTVWSHPIKRTLEITECPFRSVGDLCLGLQRLWKGR